MSGVRLRTCRTFVQGVSCGNGGAGALAIGLAQAVAVWKLPAQWMDAVAFSLLLGVLAMRPNGLFGGERRMEVAA